MGPGPGALQVGVARDPELPLRVEDEREDLGKHAPVEIDQRGVADGLIVEPGFRIGGHFDDEKIGTVATGQQGLDESVRESSGLNELGLERSPGEDVGDSGKAENRVSVMLNEPLAAFVVFVHRGSRHRAGLVRVRIFARRRWAVQIVEMSS